MTGERRTPWRVVEFAESPRFLVVRKDNRPVARFYTRAEADLAVADHNAVGADPVRWEWRYYHKDGDWSDWILGTGTDNIEYLSKSPDHEVRFLYAAPIAARLEPVGEVEWRVPLPDLLALCGRAEKMDPEILEGLIGQQCALDLRDARAALARRPEGAWRDIASAPRDDDEAFDGWGKLIGRVSNVRRDSETNTWVSTAADGAESKVADHLLTHWMPLPPPPDADTPENRKMLKRLAGTPGDDAGGRR